MKKALITGVTGQDGSYLAEFSSKRGMKFTALNAALRSLIRSVSITFMKTHMSSIKDLSFTMVI
jgi:GDP-D-mannose dehydratase